MADIVLTATIGEDRRLVLDLPPDAPVGEVEVLIRPFTDLAALIDEDYGTSPATVAEILASPMVGLWIDRDDIGDSVEYAEQKRRELWERGEQGDS